MPVRGSTRRGRREHQRRFQVVVVGEVNSLSEAPRRRPAAEGDVFPLRACCSWLRFFRGGAQTTRTGSNCFLWMGQPNSRGPKTVSHPPHEPPFDLQRKGSGGRGRTRGTRRARPATHVVPRTARDIPDQRRQVSVKAHKTTGAQTTEPEHHNGEFVNDVCVSPIDEVSASRGRTVTCDTTTPDWSQRISSAVTPNNTKSASWKSKTAVTVHHVGARRTSFWKHLGSISCQKKCFKKCRRVHPGRTTLHVSQNLRARR